MGINKYISAIGTVEPPYQQGNGGSIISAVTARPVEAAAPNYKTNSIEGVVSKIDSRNTKKRSKIGRFERTSRTGTV